ncbi:MAG: ATP-dependent zinc metalloprotease FtsH [Ruminococcaceae bacterium]|nr:ATP-dependent zinc metalloprotease FtsH [Oscillospiraceae bacterium]
MKVNVKNIVFFLLLIVCFILAAVVLTDMMTAKEEFTYSDLKDKFNNHEVKSFFVDTDGYITLNTVDENGKEVSYVYRLSYSFQYEWLEKTADEQHAAGIIEEYNFEEIKETPWFVSWLPYIIILIVFVGFWIYMMNQATGRGGKMNSFARSRAKLSVGEKNSVKFADVAGADEEKEELEEVVEFLKNPAKFTGLGARIPHGVLLVGPPGTGKTLLAKAVAGEAGVPFYSISGSDFVEMYVGVGASRVRDLFENARKSPASIIFIDEIDAVGRHRGAGLGGGHDEREQTLNQLLVEMDGFDKHEGIIVIAATNRPDILDPALLRPGRFDRQITVNYPNLTGREDILKVHLRNKPIEDSVDVHKIAQTTVGFTGADLANLLNEAALLAARRNKHLIGMDEIEEATLKIMVGTEKKSARITEDEKRKTAYHEAGHAILAHLLKSQDPVRRISVIPSGRALGYTLNPPEKDKYSVYKNQLKEEISMLLGGRVAEKIIYDDVSGGASNDIMRATQIARNMVTKYGMSDELGTIQFGSEHGSDEVFLGRDFNSQRDYSEATAAKIDNEIKRIIDEAFAKAEEILRANIEKLHFIAEFLVKYEVMDDAQFKAAMDDNATMEQLAAMIEEKNKKSADENAKAKEEADRKAAEAKKDDNSSDKPDGPEKTVVWH